MPTPTYTPLANITLGSSAASVTFSSISQAYRDLVLVLNPIADAVSALRYQVNSDSGANYHGIVMSGNGSSPNSAAYAGDTYALFNIGYGTIRTTAALNTQINFLDYSATDKHKTMLTRHNLDTSGTNAFAHRWASTSAITSITFTAATANFTSGSTFALYGIAA